MGEILAEPGECHALQVLADGRASFGPCGAAPSKAAFIPPQWEEIVAHFAPFAGKLQGAQIIFHGRGLACGPAWERALLNWVRESYNSLYTGHPCSACNTVIAWSFGETAPGSGMCSYLWSTGYGYAYSGTVDCVGGQATIVSQGWLDDSEWVELDAWINSRAEVYVGETGASYLLGSGEQEMDAAEIELLAVWAQAVQARLAGASQKNQP
jgi:hypothetical protein